MKVSKSPYLKIDDDDDGVALIPVSGLEFSRMWNL